MNPKHIVVAIDLSPHSKYVVTAAAAYARAFGVPMTLVHTLEVTPSPPGLEGLALTGLPPDWAKRVIESRREIALSRLTELRDEAIRETAGLTIQLELLHGSLPDTLLDFLGQSGPLGPPRSHLLIVGTHGRTGVARVLLGSVAERLVRHAPCPVLVIRPEHVEE